MKKLVLLPLAFALLGAGEPLSTDRHVAGIITAVEPATMTISTTSQHSVTGKIDRARTKVLVNGHAGKTTDLQVTAQVKGELCLDDVWLVIDTH